MEKRFDKLAESWDENPIPKAIAEAFYTYVKAHTEIDKESVIMDYGCGTGHLTLRFAQDVHWIEGMDNSENMLNELARKQQELGIENVALTLQAFGTDPFPQAFFDMIVSSMTLHHLDDTNFFLDECFYALKPGGRIYIADLDSEDGTFHPADAGGIAHHGFERDALKALAEKCGFKEVAFETLYTVEKEDKQYPVFMLCARKEQGWKRVPE